MNDFLSIILENEKDIRSKEEICNRSLIASIFYQAMMDAVFPKRPALFRSARIFINPNNKMFRYYCELLDYDPEFISRKIWDYIPKKMEMKNRDGRKYNKLGKQFERNKKADITS